VFIGFARHDVLKLEFSPLVVNALMTAFPSYSKEKAELRLNKYVKTLERLMRRAKLNKTSKRSKKKTYELEATVLWDKTGQLGSDKIRVHQWLMENRVPLVINTNLNYKPSKELAVFKPTKYLTIKNESLLDLMRSMTVQERTHFLDTPSVEDIDEINDYLKDYRAVSAEEQRDRYDLVDVDIESVKNYLKKLSDGQVFIEYFKQESDADNSEYILRIAQLNNGQLPQLKEKSDFGRNYYKNKSVQNVSKRVREAFLGDSWEYDCKSCSASWKTAFAWDYYNNKKRHKVKFEDSFSALTLYLEHKSDFFDEVIDRTYLVERPYSHEYKTKVIKEAMTAIGFGAKLTMGSWRAKDGETKSSSLLEVFDENTTLLRRFMDCTIVREYNDEQAILNKYIVKKFSTDETWLAEMEASRIRRKRISYKQNQKISWLFQHAETRMMNIVRKKLQKLGKTVLANVHDAIVVRERLTASELLAIERLVRRITKVQYFALGETQYTKS
jgi:hypothetical protein